MMDNQNMIGCSFGPGQPYPEHFVWIQLSGDDCAKYNNVELT